MSILDLHCKTKKAKNWWGVLRLAVSIYFCTFLLIFYVTPASAQCEMPGTTMATAGAIVGTDTAALNANFLAPVGILPLAYEAQLTIAQAFLYTALNDQETTILKRMDKFWADWLKALQDMTAQLNGGINDQTRQLNSLFDSSGENNNARDMQNAEIKAKKQYQPTDVGCRFDSLAPYISTATNTARVISRELGNDAADQGSAKKGTPAAKGPGSTQKAKWDNVVSKFCNPDSNGAHAGCTANGSLKDADVLPSKTVFGKLTYDDIKTNPDVKLALDTLVQNITGYTPAVPVPRDAQDSPVEIEHRLKQRSYAAQMNTVTALLTDVEAERMPSKKADEAQALRQRMGISKTPSPNPSERELRQAVLEQLWDPGYYVGLGDAPATATQKEVYLQAYNLMLLYKLVNRVEKISDVYAVQAATVLQKDKGGKLDDHMSDIPLH